MRLNDDDYVRDQYQSTKNLNARTSVWQAHEPGRSPQDLALAAASEVTPQRLLEVGCGTGTFALRIAKEVGCEVVATDSSTAMVEAGRARGVRSLTADVRNLPFDEASFDVVVAAWMLYHVHPLEEALNEIVRVLRPNGRLVAVTNGRSHLAELWQLVNAKRDEPPFSVENGARILRTHFSKVEQLDVATTARFDDRTAAATYLRSIARDDLVDALPSSGWPFFARGASSVFIADVAER